MTVRAPIWRADENILSQQTATAACSWQFIQRVTPGAGRLGVLTFQSEAGCIVIEFHHAVLTIVTGGAVFAKILAVLDGKCHIFGSVTDDTILGRNGKLSIAVVAVYTLHWRGFKIDLVPDQRKVRE